MSDPFVPRVGGVLSADIAVPEHERELRFYSRVLTSGEQPLWREDLMNNQGLPIIGLGARTKELDHLPLQWMPHIQVADVAASAKRAVALGGDELMHAKDDAGASPWAVLRDPNGAAFGIIPVVPAEEIASGDASASGDAASAMGHIAWLDLTASGAAETRTFYQEVIPWSVQEVAMKVGDEAYSDFNMLGGDGNSAAGICHARGVNQGLPPVWMLYLPVGDLSESLRRVEAEGGSVFRVAPGADGSPATAFIEDPVGVWFALAAT